MRRHHDPIVHPLSLAASSHNSGAPQVGQMPRYLGLRLIQNLDEVTDADFLVAHQVEETQPCIVSQGLEEALDVECPFLQLHKIIIYVLTDVSRANIVVLANMYQGEIIHDRQVA